MSVVFTKGDIFGTKGLGALAQVVNAAGTMDAGVSAAFKKRWPRMFEDYQARCQDGRLSLGDVFTWSEPELTIYNLVIQKHWKDKAKWAALSKSLETMVKLAEQSGITQLGMPRIASGLGGLDWTRVRKVLGEIAGTSPVEIVVFEQFVRSKEATDA